MSNTWNISQDAGGLVKVEKGGVQKTLQPYSPRHEAISKGGPIRANGWQTANFPDPETDFLVFSKTTTTDSTEDFNFMILADSLTSVPGNNEYLVKIDAGGGNRAQISINAQGDNLRYELYRENEDYIQINTDISHLHDGSWSRVEYKNGIISLNGEDILKAKYKFKRKLEFTTRFIGHSSTSTTTSNGMFLTILEGDVFYLNGDLDSYNSAETLTGDVTFEDVPTLNGIIQVNFKPSNDLRFGKAQQFLINVNDDSVTVDGVDMTGDTAENMVSAINTVLQTDITP